jgi:hypothetical protein
MAEAVPHDEECFFIAPIGAADSDIRKRSNGVRDFIVKPAAQELGLTTLRADDLDKPGQITLQVIEHVLRAKAAVADLTGANANVYYELAVRHTAKLPVVLIAEQDEISKLPFDISQMRVIGFDHKDLASAAAAQEQIKAHMLEGVGGAVDSPIATAINLEALEQGNSAEKAIAELVTRVDGLTTVMRQVVDESQTDRRRLEALLFDLRDDARFVPATGDAVGVTTGRWQTPAEAANRNPTQQEMQYLDQRLHALGLTYKFEDHEDGLHLVVSMPDDTVTTWTLTHGNTHQVVDEVLGLADAVRKRRKRTGARNPPA